MKIFRRLIVVSFAFVFIMMLLIVGLMLFVDPNKLKPILTQEVSKKSGYQLIIDGRLSWSFYPLLGIKMEHMTLTAPGERNAMADLQEVTLSTKWWQLLQGKQKLQGNIRVAKLRIMNIQAQNARLTLHWQDDRLLLQPLMVSLYGGSLQGTLEAQSLSLIPMWRWNLQFDHIELQSLLKDINGPNSKISVSGVGKVALQGNTQGKSKEQLLNHLQGTVVFSLNKGILDGVDINYFVRSADALLNKQFSLPVNTNQTLCDQLTGSATIKNGIAKNDDLLLVSNAFTTKGQGTIDLTNQTLDYRLLVTPVNATKLKWPVPILVDGSLNHPSVRLDSLTLKSLLAKDEIEKVKTKVQDQIKKLPEKANQLLQKFLGS